MTDPGFPRGEANPKGGAPIYYLGIILSKTARKLKKLSQEGMRIPIAPLLSLYTINDKNSNIIDSTLKIVTNFYTL